MSILKSIIISFSIYSKLPVPQFEWKEEDMKYTLCFFPWVGIVIGLVFWGWSVFCFHYGIEPVCYACIGAAIPLILSGGFHVDGFMDTMDAFHSYQPRERKLEILKDSHIGAFAAIMLALYYLIYVGALSQVKSLPYAVVLSFGFFVSRTLSGIGVVSFQSARSDGMLYTFASTAHKRIVKISLYLQLIIGIILVIKIAVYPALLMILAGGASFLYYWYKSKKELGGITGDTAGFFVTICEAAFVVAAAISQILGI